MVPLLPGLTICRYGPPPSYPHLKKPGLNAPVPPGASFGYHPGGWGKPPVDEQWRSATSNPLLVITSAAAKGAGDVEQMLQELGTEKG